MILDGEAEYRDSEGNHVQASTGEVLLLSTQPGVSYSEHNLSKDKPLTRINLAGCLPAARRIADSKAGA